MDHGCSLILIKCERFGVYITAAVDFFGLGVTDILCLQYDIDLIHKDQPETLLKSHTQSMFNESPLPLLNVKSIIMPSWSLVGC